MQHAGAIPGGDLQAQVSHQLGHNHVHVAVDAQVRLAVLGVGGGSGGGRGLAGALGREAVHTYVLGGLKVDDDQPASTAFGGKGQVPAGPDLQRGAQRDGQVCVPGARSWIRPSAPARASTALTLPHGAGGRAADPTPAWDPAANYPCRAHAGGPGRPWEDEHPEPPSRLLYAGGTSPLGREQPMWRLESKPCHVLAACTGQEAPCGGLGFRACTVSPVQHPSWATVRTPGLGGWEAQYTAAATVTGKAKPREWAASSRKPFPTPPLSWSPGPVLCAGAACASPLRPARPALGSSGGQTCWPRRRG